MVPITYLNATTIEWVAYNLFTKRLRVKFRRGSRIAEFQRVPAPVYRALIAASSHDRFFRTEIEKVFPVRVATASRWGIICEGTEPVI